MSLLFSYIYIYIYIYIYREREREREKEKRGTYGIMVSDIGNGNFTKVQILDEAVYI